MVMDQEREYLSQGLAAGAVGVLPKQHVAGQIVRAIAAVRQGKIYIPPQTLGNHSPRNPGPKTVGPGPSGWNNC